MTAEWLSFIQNKANENMSPVAKGVEHVKSQACIMPLLQFGLIKISGKDAQAFMQSQFSNDVNAIDDTTLQLNGYCNPKGRLLASFLIYKQASEYYLITRQDVITPSINRLRMFVLRSDVKLEDVTSQYAIIGVAGQDLATALHSVAANVPGADNKVIHTNNLSIVQPLTVTPRVMLIVAATDAISVWESLAASCLPTSQAFWQLLSVQAGQPEISAETAEAFVPQMVNLHVTHGVSFKKGCYPGQEIVARTQYLGKLKKRSFRVEIQSDTEITAGTDIYQSATDDQQSVGKVLLVAAKDQHLYEALVVLQISQADSHPQALHVGTKTGPALTLLELPYSFPEAS